MSANNTPKVSIGLPVYNGENFLEEAIQSILAQTFKDFELVVSDNASTDRTEAICRGYEAQDERIRYYRNQENIGASGNYRRVFELSSGEYFKWAAHDDICRPDLLLRCVEVLDQDPSVVLCYPRAITIDEKGNPGKRWSSRPEFGSETPHRRFREALSPVETFPIWGLARANILRKTHLLGNYPGHDLPLLAELTLHGRFYEIQEFLFFGREHRQRSVRVYDFSKPHEAVGWYDPKRIGRIIFPAWRLFAEYIAGINRAPVGWGERVWCYREMAGWFGRHRHELMRDLKVAGRHVPGVGPILARLYKGYVKSRWMKLTEKAARDLKSVIPMDAVLILVDEAKFANETFSKWRTIPFTEREGKYCGPPVDDRTAIQELERLRKAGANFIAFGWPAFWWLDHYSQLCQYLRSRFSCVLENDRLVVFDLRA